MYLINNKPIIDLSPYVSTDLLVKMKPFLDYAVVKSSYLATPSRYYNFQLLDKTHKGVNDVIQNQYNYDFVEDLKDNDQFASWLRYNQNVAYGQQSIQINSPTNWYTKHLAIETFPTAAKKYWNDFFVWMETQNIFTEYGRVVVFLNEPNSNTPIHLDSADASRKDEFIWISLDTRKKMFVYDFETKQKYYLDTTIGIFDTTNYHGAEVGDLACWSLRVDGIFSDDFLHKTGLYEHYRNR